MKQLKDVLSQDKSKKTKEELIQLITSLHSLIGSEAYEEVCGLNPSELSHLTGDEVVSIVESFNEGYQSQWEKNLSGASVEVIKSLFNMVEIDKNPFEVANASDADFAAELGSIDFEKLIAGPLNAAVNAQASASLSTVNFIREVGFEKNEDGSSGEIRMVDFSYKRTKDDGTTEDVEINVPFISILNIPSLRIETVDIDFNVKLNSVFTKDVTTSFGVDADVSAGWGPVKFKVSASYKRSSSTGVKVEKEYTMGVKVKATNDEMPAGLERVLNLLASPSDSSSS